MRVLLIEHNLCPCAINSKPWLPLSYLLLALPDCCSQTYTEAEPEAAHVRRAQQVVHMGGPAGGDMGTPSSSSQLVVQEMSLTFAHVRRAQRIVRMGGPMDDGMGTQNPKLQQSACYTEDEPDVCACVMRAAHRAHGRPRGR